MLTCCLQYEMLILLRSLTDVGRHRDRRWREEATATLVSATPRICTFPSWHSQAFLTCTRFVRSMSLCASFFVRCSSVVFSPLPSRSDLPGTWTRHIIPVGYYIHSTFLFFIKAGWLPGGTRANCHIQKYVVHFHNAQREEIVSGFRGHFWPQCRHKLSLLSPELSLTSMFGSSANSSGT